MTFAVASSSGWISILSALAFAFGSTKANAESEFPSPIYANVGYAGAIENSSCRAHASTATRGQASVGLTTKGGQILGQPMSALEKMRAQQSDFLSATRTNGVKERLNISFAPSATRSQNRSSTCTVGFGDTSSALTITAKPKAGFLASKLVKVSRTTFDRDWARVGSESMSGMLPSLLIDEGASSLEAIRSINQWVNQTIRYVDDRTLFGRADYWAGARLTMQLAMGDCEDIALTKMQLLAASGFDRDDMFLTIARDKVRRADHALLIVKVRDRFLVLDSGTNILLDGSSAHEYQPLVSLGRGQAWVHGI